MENNFNSIPFLAAGGYSSSTATVAGVLNPWPSVIAPVTGCGVLRSIREHCDQWHGPGGIKLNFIATPDFRPRVEGHKGVFSRQLHGQHAVHGANLASRLGYAGCS